MRNWTRTIFLIMWIVCFINLTFAATPQDHFVLVHGAWHGAWCWYELKTELESSGHRVDLVELPAHGIDPSDPLYIGLPEYQLSVTDVLDGFDEPAILVGHSMGGVAVSLAAEARPLKVKKLVYLAAFMLTDGQCLLDIAAQDSTSEVLPALIINPAEGTIDIRRENITGMFYNLTPQSYINLASSLIRPNPLAPFVTPLTLSPGNYGSIERFYIYTTQDHAITYPIQQLMVAAQPCTTIFSLDSDHSPFFSAVKELSKILDDIAGGKY